MLVDTGRLLLPLSTSFTHFKRRMNGPLSPYQGLLYDPLSTHVQCAWYEQAHLCMWPFASVFSRFCAGSALGIPTRASRPSVSLQSRPIPGPPDSRRSSLATAARGSLTPASTVAVASHTGNARTISVSHRPSLAASDDGSLPPNGPPLALRSAPPSEPASPASTNGSHSPTTKPESPPNLTMPGQSKAGQSAAASRAGGGLLPWGSPKINPVRCI